MESVGGEEISVEADAVEDVSSTAGSDGASVGGVDVLDDTSAGG